MRALLTAAFLGLVPAATMAQANMASPAAERLRVTTTSEEASRQFFAGLSDARNIFPSRATTHFERAIAADGSFGLARVFRGAFAPGLTPAERTAEMDRGIASMGGATTGELVVALALRELPNNQRSRALWETAAKLLPGDPTVAFYAALATPPPGNTAALRSVTDRFPDDGAAYNVLAYQLWQQGNREGGFNAVRRYVQLAPDHPNPHDSYAELLQWSGLYAEALAHYGRAVQLDSSFSEGYMGLADVLQLTGKGVDARRQVQQAIARAPSKFNAVVSTRALGRSFLMDGFLKDGMDQLAAAARDARGMNRNGFAAQTYREMAIADALLGRGTAVASNLAAAVETSSADDPQTLTAIVAAQAWSPSGDLAAARQAAQKLATAARADSQYANTARVANAIMLLRDGKPRDALTALSGAPPDDAMARTLTAECYVATGNLADARTLKNLMLNDPQLTLENGYNVLARIRAAKIKA